MAESYWLVRPGAQGEIASQVNEKNVVAIGWPSVGDISELILERNSDFNYSYQVIDEYNVYYKEGEEMFNKLSFNTKNFEGSGVTDNYSIFFDSCTLDIKYVNIYDEPLEYLNAGHN